MDEAHKVAISETVLPPEALFADIYANTPPQKIRGTTLEESVTQAFTTTNELLKQLGRTPKQY